MSGERVSVRLHKLIREKRIRSYRGLLRCLSALGPEYSDVYRYAVKNRCCWEAYFLSKRMRAKGNSGRKVSPVR